MIYLGNLYGTCFILGSQSANPRLKGGQAGTDRAIGTNRYHTNLVYKPWLEIHYSYKPVCGYFYTLCILYLISRNTYKSWLKSNNDPGVGVFGEDVPENIEPGLLWRRSTYAWPQEGRSWFRVKIWAVSQWRSKSRSLGLALVKSWFRMGLCLLPKPYRYYIRYIHGWIFIRWINIDKTIKSCYTNVIIYRYHPHPSIHICPDMSRSLYIYIPWYLFGG